MVVRGLAIDGLGESSHGHEVGNCLYLYSGKLCLKVHLEIGGHFTVLLIFLELLNNHGDSGHGRFGPRLGWAGLLPSSFAHVCTVSLFNR